MTEELFDQINNFASSPSVDKFEYLTENVERVILNVMGDRKFAYVEADYFGGKGGQMAMIWSNEKREPFLDFGQNKINEVLKSFGVIAYSGQDELMTLGFGLRRHTKEWLRDAT